MTQEIQYYVTEDRMLREDRLIDEDDRLQIEALKKRGPVEFITFVQFMEHIKAEIEKGTPPGPVGDAGALREAPQPAEGFHIIKSKAQFMGMGHAAEKTSKQFSKMTQRMTRSQAEYIRKLRIEQGYTWRLIARACAYQNWQGWKRWAPISNQLMGMALCDRAARMFNEDFRAKPWN